jgi:hypothetical protein
VQGKIIRMRPGDAPDEDDWYSAAADRFMCHLASLDGVPTGDGTAWLAPITDQQYQATNEQ